LIAPYRIKHGTARTLLVVEDEPLVRVVVTEYLQDCGFRTFEAADATEAKRILAGPVPIDILFTDVRLPGESGLDLARWCRANHPEVRILLTSGHHQMAADASDLSADGPLLQKPYGLGELLRRFEALTLG
jgi:DNA-binding response OmpR family regulator